MEKIQELIQTINEQTGEQFHAVEESENWVRLFSGTAFVMESWDYEVEARLKQIAKEEGVMLTP